jgi:hypothetical protein
LKPPVAWHFLRFLVKDVMMTPGIWCRYGFYFYSASKRQITARRGLPQMAVTIINLVLTTVILALGIWAFVKRKSDVALYIGIGFGLFAISHALTLAGLAASLDAFIIVIRIIGYLLVIVALCRILMKK